MPSRAPSARILFDESHSQAWTIRPEIAHAMQPSHPEDSSYALAAEALRRRDLEVAVHEAGLLGDGVLEGADVLVLAHPSDAAWERVVPGGSPNLSVEELEAIEAFVRAGGGLIVLGESEQAKYGDNLNDLLAPFGIRIENDTLSDYARHRSAPHWIVAELKNPDGGVEGDGVDVLARVHEACFYRAGRLAVAEEQYDTAIPAEHEDDLRDVEVLARASATASTPHAALLAVTTHGEGRVVVAADSDLFGDDCLGELDHEALWLNLVHWAAGGAFRRPAAPVDASAIEDAHWATLKAEVDSLRLKQQPDGSVDLDEHDAVELRVQVDAIIGAVRGLAPRFPHQAGYLQAVEGDLRAWADGGYEKPDFTAALERFRPDLQREDGIQHLVVFPMYKQNGSRDKVFEALIVNVPWPEWLAELERTRYDNPKFVPVTLVDYTAGYASECAVLFPETVSVAGKPVNHFGGIFCDREAARFRATSARAVEMLRLNLPPDAAALLESEQLSRDAYELWDLIHDRAHSHGDLPFDPFMIRQRMPYWMYSLEELRCDLTAFSEAVKLEGEGFAFARHVQYAILFDRLFRFPITGPRVRNYDGLGGQLLFAYLHETRRLHWTDNRLSIEWEQVAEGVLELRERVEALYRSGIQRTKLQHWAAAHDLVAEFVPPATASRWVKGVRAFADVAEPKPYIDEVLDDEFPLSLFYVSLQQKLAAEPVAA
jgi:hypothetical protein